jgi:hypothetical protein
MVSDGVIIALQYESSDARRLVNQRLDNSLTMLATDPLH